MGERKMKWERFSCLQEKEVINICDGRRLGCVCDLEMDAISGKICTLIIPECGSKWNFFGKEGHFSCLGGVFAASVTISFLWRWMERKS